MKNFETTRATASSKIASRPVRAALAVKIAFAIMAANVSFAAAKAIFQMSGAAAPIVSSAGDSAKPFIIPVDDNAESVPQAAARKIQVASLPSGR